MEFIIGLLTAVVFFICLFVAFHLGKKQTKKSDKPQLTEDEQRQKDLTKQYNEHFKKLFRYDIDTAIQRKKV